MPLPLLLLALLASSSAVQAVPPPADCHEWHECRDRALEAAARHDYEEFHDWAWRTVQTGPKHDAANLFMLARAQSLSGRPHDALVMLERLAEMGVATDAASNDDFRSVRTLDGWPAVRSLIFVVGLSGPAIDPATLASSVFATQPAPRARKTARQSRPVVARSKPVPAPPTPPAAAASASDTLAAAPTSDARPTPESTPNAAEASSAAASTRPPSKREVEDILRIASRSFAPAGLAYDRVSGRFVLADRDDRKLLILDERSKHVVDLVDAASAGFYEITALEIDARRGDLWVVSANAAPSKDEPATLLHKLQLVSGRPLATLPLPRRFGPARFVDVAVSASGTVFVLDTSAGRIFVLPPGGRRFDTTASLALESPVSLAPVDDRILYVAHADGLVRVDRVTGRASAVRAAKTTPLSGLEHIRWDRNGLVAIQRMSSDERRVVSIALPGAGQRATALTVIQSAVPLVDPTTLTVSEGDIYFLTRERQTSGSDGEMVVRRARVR
jgi:hypothetical protein